MILDTSVHGVVDGLKRAAKVVGWHVAANAVVLVGALIANVHVGTNDEKYLYVTSAVALANALLAGIGKWLKTVQPTADPIG